MKIASWFATKASDDEFTESSVCAAISRDHCVLLLLQIVHISG